MTNTDFDAKLYHHEVAVQALVDAMRAAAQHGHSRLALDVEALVRRELEDLFFTNVPVNQAMRLFNQGRSVRQVVQMLTVEVR